MAKELADLYPAFAQKLAELLSRIAANDREIEYINGHALPRGADRLLVAELKARGLPLGRNSVETPRITNRLYLPPWQPRSNYLWPREHSGAESERDALLVEAARFYPGASDREIARRLRIALLPLLNYQTGRWPRTRVELRCPHDAESAMMCRPNA